MNKEQFLKKRLWLASKGIIPSMYKGDAMIKTIVAWFGNTTLNPSIHISLHKYIIPFIFLLVLSAINSKKYKVYTNAQQN
jgi:hypothetical protein